MTKRIFTLLSLCLLLWPAMSMAQTKKSFTLDELMWGGSRYWEIMPKGHSTAWWGDRLMEIDGDNVRQITDAAGRRMKENVTFTLTDIRNGIGEGYGKFQGLSGKPFPEADKAVVAVTTGKAYVTYDWKKKKIMTVTPRGDKRQHEDFQPVSKRLAYVCDYNLYVSDAEGKTMQVSKDGNREIQYGLSVHRDEFGIHKGTFWSPKGNLLAFYRMDQTMVADYPLVDISTRVAQLAPEKYPMAGMTSHKVQVGVFNPVTQKTVYLQTGDPTDRYFTNIAWSPDEKTVYVMELPRTQDKAELVAYDATTGKRGNILYTETNKRYVEPMNPIVFLPWDSSKFVMQSRKDGYNHLYLFSAEGKELKQLTKGAFEVTDVLGFNEKARSIVYVSNEILPIQRNLCSVSVETAERMFLDNGVGSHRGVLSAAGNYVFDIWSMPDMYRRYDMLPTARKSGKNPVKTIWTVEEPWQGYNVPEITSGKIKAADGKTDLYYRLVKPVGFDASKKYPTVVYVYGGPHAHNVEASWNYMARPWEIYMAQRGYVVYVVDNRGSEARGFEFESCTHRHLGDIEMADQMEGVKFLKSLPYVDADKIGVHGWSFGGYMTTNLMCSYPETFKVGVAGGPVIDWKYYEVMYGERYMDTPQENPEGYASSSLLPKAKNLKGRLQIIVGYNDPTCILQHNLSFLRACEDAGTQPDYFVYPGQGHNMMGKDMVHLHERITRYFDDYLK